MIVEFVNGFPAQFFIWLGIVDVLIALMLNSVLVEDSSSQELWVMRCFSIVILGMIGAGTASVVVGVMIAHFNITRLGHLLNPLGSGMLAVYFYIHSYQRLLRKLWFPRQ